MALQKRNAPVAQTRRFGNYLDRLFNLPSVSGRELGSCALSERHATDGASRKIGSGGANDLAIPRRKSAWNWQLRRVKLELPE